MKIWPKYNKIDHENEVKVRWHMPGWHAPLWSMCGQNMVSLVCMEWRNWSNHKNTLLMSSLGPLEKQYHWSQAKQKLGKGEYDT